MNYEAAKRAAMRGETVRRCSWATGREIRINSSVWFDSYTDTHDALTNDDMAATDWVIVRWQTPREIAREALASTEHLAKGAPRHE